MNDEDIKHLASQLKLLPEVFLPFEVFNEIARLAALTAIEFVPFRKNGDAIELLLFRRSKDDPFWPNALHTPGTIVRSSDTSFESCFDRLFKEELKSEKVPVQFIGNDLVKMNRGRVILFKYIVDVTGIDTDGEFYDVTHLPEDLIPQQKEIALQAVPQFRATQ